VDAARGAGAARGQFSRGASPGAGDGRFPMSTWVAQLKGSDTDCGPNGRVDDHTGGPRGQLACDLGLAQFLLDNAAHSLDPGRGIDHLRDRAELHNHNGYLVNAAAGGQLQPALVSILAALDVPVAGVDPGLTHLPAAAAHMVGLVYASAVPMGAAYGNAGPPRGARGQGLADGAVRGRDPGGRVEPGAR